MASNKLTACIFLISLLIFAGCKKDDDSVADPTLENKKPLGTSAEELLSDATYKSMTLEIAYPEGFRPAQQTFNYLTSFLEQRVKKPSGIQIIETIIPNPTGNSVSIQKVREIEDEYRTRYSEGDEIAVFIYFSGLSSSNDTNSKVTLGTAYRNTSIVAYDKTLRDISSSSVTINLVMLQSTTILHEFGHLFSLVNIQSDDIHADHEDTQYNKHCKVEDCLMYFETTVSKSKIADFFINKSTISTLDTLCIEDLVAKGGKV